MTGYKKVNLVAEEAKLVGAGFISLTTEQTAILKNNENGSVWEVPYGELAESIGFDGENAKIITPPKEIEDEFKKNTNDFRNAIGNIFEEDYEKNIGELKTLIRDIPYIEEKDIFMANKKDDIKLKADTPITIAMTEMAEAKKDLLLSGILFNSSGDINRGIVSGSALRRIIEEVSVEEKKFVSFIEQYTNFKKAITEKIGAEETQLILEGFDFESDIEIGAAKAVTVAKASKKVNVNAVNATKVIIEAANKFMFGEEMNAANAVPFTYNFVGADTSRPKYLKFRSGVFQHEDVKIMSTEIDRAMGNKDLTAEELEKLGNCRVTVEYMLQSKQINDKILEDMIKDFNKTFIKTDNDYESNPLGWRTRDEQMADVVLGMAR